MKKICCEINLFSSNFPIWIIDTMTGEKELAGDALVPQFIPSHISAIADKYGIKNIHLFGVEKYVYNFVNEIQEVARNKYNYNDNYYEIEVN